VCKICRNFGVTCVLSCVLFQATDALEMMLLSVLSPAVRCEWKLQDLEVAMISMVSSFPLSYGHPYYIIRFFLLKLLSKSDFSKVFVRFWLVAFPDMSREEWYHWQWVCCVYSTRWKNKNESYHSSGVRHINWTDFDDMICCDRLAFSL